MPPDESAGWARPPSRRGDGPADRVLAARVRQGDRDAYERLVRRYLRPIHAVAASFLSEPADVEDAAQETFLRALDGIDGYDPDRPFAPWLYQIARNVARDRLGTDARRRAEPLPESGPAWDGPGPAESLDRAEIRRRVEEAAAGLPDRQRTAFRLVDVEGWSAADVAGLTGLAPGTVRSHLHHARRKLRDELAPLLERRDER